MNFVLAFGGKKHSGKSLSAKLIYNILKPSINELGLDIQILSFATPMRADLYKVVLEPLSLVDNFNHLITEKEYWRTATKLWSRFRKTYFGNDYWLKQTEELVSKSKNTLFIIDDLRFPHEVEMLTKYNALFCKIIKSDLEIDEDETEHALDEFNNWEFTIINDGTIDELTKKLKILSLGVIIGIKTINK